MSELLEARVSALEARVAALADQVRDLDDDLDGLRREIREDWAELRQEIRDLGSKIEGIRIEALEARITELVEAIREPVPTSKPQGVSSLWLTESGRKVVWWVVVGGVLGALALGGGMTFGDLLTLAPDALSDGTPTPAIGDL